jgi:hypothetical protein
MGIEKALEAAVIEPLTGDERPDRSRFDNNDLRLASWRLIPVP